MLHWLPYFPGLRELTVSYRAGEQAKENWERCSVGVRFVIGNLTWKRERETGLPVWVSVQHLRASKSEHKNGCNNLANWQVAHALGIWSIGHLLVPDDTFR